MVKTENEILESKALRDEISGRVEVLDKVKELFLLPKLDMMTMQQVADYYSVSLNVLNSCFQRNKEEIETDGAVKMSVKSMSLRFAQNARTKQYRGYGEIELSDDITLRVPNAGIVLFPKRAILRIGMLLRDSEVAKEVRTQLLNTFEHATDAQRTEEIDTEMNLLEEIGRQSVKSMVTGDPTAFLAAQKVYRDYWLRYRTETEQQLREKTEKLEAEEKKNKDLNMSNKMLAADILSWTEPASVNRAIRIIADRCDKYPGAIFNELYTELLYKHGISVKVRATKRNQTYLSTIHQDEWPQLQQSLCAICEKYGLNPATVFRKAKLTA